MRLLVIFIISSIGLVQATNSYAQKATVSLDVRNQTVKEVLDEIEDQSDFTFFFNNRHLDLQRRVSVSEKRSDIFKVLDRIFAGTNVGYSVLDKKIILSVEGKVAQQTGKRITGTVVDKSGEPVIGANVVVKGTTNGTITDVDGKYTLEVPEGSVLQVSYIGYNPAEVKVGKDSMIRIVLQEDTQALDEVVVVGYGTQKKVNLTGAVGSVRPEDMGDIQTNSVSSMIKGHLSGVQITQNSGKPGAGSTIRIRGVGTIGAVSSHGVDDNSKNNPLLVVDGQAVDYGIETIDPNDIESVSVLKDASSAAIYGARAANGVLLITTKRGTKGVGKLSVNAYVSVQTLMKDYDLLNAEQFVMLQNEARANAGMESLFSHEPAYYGKGTNWVDEVTQLAPVQEYNVNFSKATDDSNYYVSGTFFSQEGIVKNTGYDRASFRFTGDNKILPKLKVGNSVTLTWNESYGNSRPLSDAVIAAPTMPVRNEDGSWGTGVEKGEGNPTNPVYMTELYKGHKESMWRTLANIYAEYQILDELKFKVTGGIDFAAQNKKNYYPRVDLYGDYLDFTDQKLIDNMSLGYTWQNDYLLYFNKDWNKHHIDAMLGMSLQASQKKNNDSVVKGFLNDSEYLQVLDAGQRDWRATGGLKRWSMLSYFGNINYNFNSRYLVSFNLRADGSSRFGKENKFGYFPSGSVAWRLSEEEFMKNFTWLSNLKVRASYGSLGNQEIGLYSFSDQLDVNQWYLFGDGSSRIPGVSSINLIDPTIKWETTTITNVGLDMGFLNNTLSLVTEFYVKNTHDILLSYPIPSTVGKGSPTVNAGKVRNKGFELEVRYNNTFGDLWLNAALTYGYNKNEVRGLIGEQKFINHNYSYNVLARSEIGHPINSIYGYVFDGIYQTEEEIKNSPEWSKAEVGTPKFKDLNGDNKITSEDRTYIANAMPTSTLGLNLSMKYKNFDFSMFWQGDFGKDLYWGYFGGMFPMSGLRNVNSIWLDRWTGPGSTNEMPKVKYNAEYPDVSSWQIKSADYLRLKNLSIGYTFKVKDIMSARVYVAGQNLLTITPYPGFDPEINGIANWNAWGDSYPQSRSYTIGLNLNF